MTYAIIGFGEIGHALARSFARKGIPVSVATTRDPRSFAADAAAIGPGIIPVTLADAVKADVIFLAVRFESHPDVARALPEMSSRRTGRSEETVVTARASARLGRPRRSRKRRWPDPNLDRAPSSARAASSATSSHFPARGA